MPQIRSKQIIGDNPIKPTDLTTKEYVDQLVNDVNFTIENDSQIISSGVTSFNFVGADVDIDVDGKVNITIPIPDYINQYNNVEAIKDQLENLQEYVDTMKSNQLVIEDENNIISTDISRINFIGADVKVISEDGKVNIYIPSPQYTDSFNSGDNIVSDFPTTLRYISRPTTQGTPYNTGDWDLSIPHSTININQVPISYTSFKNSVFDYNSTFSVVILDADNITELRNIEFTISGNTMNSLSGITFTVRNWVQEYDRLMADFKVEIYINDILPTGGRFSVILRHNDTDIHEFTQSDIFFDANINAPSIAGDIILNINTPVIKTISGVKYLTTNTVFNLSVDGINNINNQSYPLSEQLNINANNLFINDKKLYNGNGGEYLIFDDGSWSDFYDKSNVTITSNNLIIDSINKSNWNNGDLHPTNVSVNLLDWYEVVTKISDNQILLIDTLVDDSNRHSERFRRENLIGFERLTSTFDIWNSEESLLTYDGGNGLQIIGDKLIYPQHDFTIYQPQEQPNYFGITGTKYYIRKFATDGNQVSNGILLFNDHNITDGDITDGVVKFELSTDLIVWLDLNKQYDIDINGCRAYIDIYNIMVNNSLNFKLYNLVENYTDSIYLRITYTMQAKDKFIGGVDFMGTYWV